MQTIRRGKFGTFHRATSFVRDTFDDNENSITSSQDGEVCVEVSVGPKGGLLRNSPCTSLKNIYIYVCNLLKEI